jgi:hypothetical protein
MAGAYSMLAEYLRRAPGKESGRCRVLLGALDESVFSFARQVMRLDDLLPLELARLKERRNQPENKIKRREYDSKPENKAKARAYREKPENKIKKRESANKPEDKIKDKERQKVYREKPENKIKKAENARRPENKIKEKEYLQKPEVKVRRRGYKQLPSYKAKAAERQKRPAVVARHKALRNSDEAKARRTAKRHAKRTSHARSTESERREIRRIGLANPDWSADELATWAFDTYSLKVKAHTVATWLAPRYKHLDADSDEEDGMEPDNADENDDKMEYEDVDQVDDEMV